MLKHIEFNYDRFAKELAFYLATTGVIGLWGFRKCSNFKRFEMKPISSDDIVKQNDFWKSRLKRIVWNVVYWNLRWLIFRKVRSFSQTRIYLWFLSFEDIVFISVGKLLIYSTTNTIPPLSPPTSTFSLGRRFQLVIEWTSSNLISAFNDALVFQ